MNVNMTITEDMVTFSNKFIRNLSESNIEMYVDRITSHANETANIEHIINLFILGFQTRWTRGGKKEKLIVYKLFKYLSSMYPNTVKACLKLLPEYGYWKDPLLFLMEYKSKLFSNKEPVLTRYSVGILAKSFTFDIQKARNKLNFQPKQTTSQAIEEFIQWYKEKNMEFYSRL